MKIFFAMGVVISEKAMADALERLGHSVTVWRSENRDFDYNTAYLEEVTKRVMEGDYDIVFSCNFKPIIARACKLLKIKYVSWTVDSPHFPLFSKTLAYDTNRVFIFDYALYEKFKDYNPGRIFYFPLGCDFYNWSRVNPSDEEAKKYAYDVCFIGSLYTDLSLYTQAKEMMSEHTRGFCDGLINAQSKVYGYNLLKDVIDRELAKKIKKEIDWEDFKEDYEEDDAYVISEMILGTGVSALERIELLNAMAKRFSTHLYTRSDTSVLKDVKCEGLADSMTMMPKIFRCSKINLNITSKPIQTGIPLRALDIMACKGFMITNYQPELNEYFENGKNVVMYTSIEEACDLAAYYLDREKERREIAENAFEIVRDNFTFEIRLEKLLEMI